MKELLGALTLAVGLAIVALGVASTPPRSGADAQAAPAGKAEAANPPHGAPAPAPATKH